MSADAMWARSSSWLLLVLLLLLVGCGAKTDVGALDAGGDARVHVSLAPALIDTWWFPLASDAPRYYVLTLCSDGRAGLRTSFLDERDPVPIWGRVRPASGGIDATASFDSADAPAGFSMMQLRYERDADRLMWLEEVEVLDGWASGGGTRERYDWIPASSAPSCE